MYVSCLSAAGCVCPPLQSAYLWITFFTRFKKPRPIILFIAIAWGKEEGTHLKEMVAHLLVLSVPLAFLSSSGRLRPHFNLGSGARVWLLN